MQEPKKGKRRAEAKGRKASENCICSAFPSAPREDWLPLAGTPEGMIRPPSPWAGPRDHRPQAPGGRSYTCP